MIKRILVVSATPAVLQLREHLGKQGLIHLVESASVDEAVSRASTSHFDLLVICETIPRSMRRLVFNVAQVNNPNVKVVTVGREGPLLNEGYPVNASVSLAEGPELLASQVSKLLAPPPRNPTPPSP